MLYIPLHRILLHRKGAVLINRGWVPKSWKTKADQAAAERQAAAAKEAAEKEAAAAAAAAAAAPAPARSWWGSRRQQAAEGQRAKQAGAKEQPAPQPPVTVVGVLQPDEQPNQFIPQNQPETDEFHYVQREALVGGGLGHRFARAICGVHLCAPGLTEV